ncbi:MAG: hypothetical protein AB2L14_18865 [Candidatus Xenobiia bacterium LiM19]
MRSGKKCYYTFCYAAIILLLLTFECTSVYPTSEHLLSLSIYMDKHKFTLSEPIYVIVTIKNEGSNPVQIFTSFVLNGYFLALELKNPAGKEMKPHTVDLFFDESIINQQSTVKLEPGAFYGRWINLRDDRYANPPFKGHSSEIYTFTQSGKYTLKALYIVPDIKEKFPDIWNGKLISNPLKFEIE